MRKLRTRSPRIEGTRDDQLAKSCDEQRKQPNLAALGLQGQKLERPNHIARGTGVQKIPGLDLSRPNHTPLDVPARDTRASAAGRPMVLP